MFGDQVKCGPKRSRWVGVLVLLISIPAFGLEVVDRFPIAHDYSVPTDTAIEVLFSEAIDPLSVDEAFQVRGEQSGPVLGSIVVDGASVQFTPDRALFPGERVVARVDPGIASVTGDVLDRPYVWVFRAAAGAAGIDLEIVQTIPTSGANDLYGGDLDRDGDVDIAVARNASGGSAVEIYWNDGSGRLGAPVGLTVGDNATRIKAWDLDDDAVLDLVVATDGTVAILFGIGDGTFEPAVALSGGFTPNDLRAADLDADGDLDLVVTGEKDLFPFEEVRSYLLLNDGAGGFSDAANLTGFLRFSPQFVSWRNGALIPEDMNGDGLYDLFSGTMSSYDPFDRAGQLRAHLATGEPREYALQSEVSEENIQYLEVADFDGDRVPDAVYSDDSGVLRVSLASAPGQFGLGVYQTAIGQDLAVGDLDGDGDLEIVGDDNGGPPNGYAVLENRPNGFTRLLFFEPDRLVESNVLFDRDGDGDLDIVLCVSNEISVVDNR